MTALFNNETSALRTEMFPMIPVGSLFRERSERGDADEFPPLSVGKQGVTPQLENVAKSADTSNRKLARRGDIVINSRSDRRGAAGLAAADGTVSVVYTVLQPGPLIDRKYAHHMIRCVGFQEEYFRHGTGIVDDLWSTRYDRMATIRVPVPPLEEQRRIADFLDRETAEIDVMDAELNHLIETLRERRDAAWASAIDSAYSAGRPVKLGMLIASIADGPFGSSLTSSHYSDDGARVIRLGNIGVNAFRNDDAAFIPLSYAKQLAAHAVVEGDVVLAGLGDENMPLGRAAVVPDIGPAIVKADCYRVRPNDLATSAYLAWAASAPQSRTQFKALSRGATRERLNTKVVQELRVPLIPLAAQTELLKEQCDVTARIDEMIADANRLKELLAERRSTLITEVVTGKKEVLA